MITPQKTLVNILEDLDSSLATAAPVMAALVPLIILGSLSSSASDDLARELRLEERGVEEVAFEGVRERERGGIVGFMFYYTFFLFILGQLEREELYDTSINNVTQNTCNKKLVYFLTL